MEEPTSKRSRGRPRKAQIQKEEDTSAKDTSNNADEKQETRALGEEKDLNNNNKNDEPNGTESPEKRTRGRPPKLIKKIDNKKQEFETESDNETNQKRGRGRPPKLAKLTKKVNGKSQKKEEVESEKDEKPENKELKENKDEIKEIKDVENESDDEGVRRLRGRAIKRSLISEPQSTKRNVRLAKKAKSSSEDDGHEEDSQPGEKRKRGRPLKNVGTVSTSTTNENNNNSTEISNSNDIPSEDKPKTDATTEQSIIDEDKNESEVIKSETSAEAASA